MNAMQVLSTEKATLFLIHRITIAAMIVLSATNVWGSVQDDTDLPRLTYQFALKKGTAQVCHAYLKRLNAIQFDDNSREIKYNTPFCGIPEDDSIAGFVKLNRVPLTEEQVVNLFPRIWWFVRAQDQSMTTDQYGGPSAILKALQRKQIVAWQYDPPLTVGNDGIKSNVVVWQGFGVDRVAGVCGEMNPAAKYEELASNYQLGFVLNDRAQIDEAATRKYFLPSILRKPPRNSDGRLFREFGWSVGIFKYQDDYYLQSYTTGSQGNIALERELKKPKFDTLQVFHQRNGNSELSCEYLMTTRLRPRR